MDKALLARVEKQALFHRYPRGLPLVTLALGLLVTVLFVVVIERNDAFTRRLTLDSDANSIVNELDREAAENIAYLTAAASLFAVADDISRDEFATFARHMSTGHGARGSLGIGWARWLDAGEATTFRLQQLRLYPDLDFTIRPEPMAVGQKMAIITMLEPRTPGNTLAQGYDMYSEPVRRTAIDLALRNRSPQASGKIRLVQDRDRGDIAGTLIYLPVFPRQSGKAPLQERPKGFVYIPVRVQDFLRVAISGAHRNPGLVELYDGAAEPANLLASASTGSGRDLETVTRSFDFAGREWTLVVSARSEPGLSQQSLMVLGFGTLVSLLVMALARVATNRAADDRKVLEWLTRQSSIRNSLTRELNHRVKNTLANVLSIVALTRRRSRDLDTFADGLNGRIRALSATHDLLSQREWGNAPVLDVVTSELAPYLDPADPHAEVSGPDALLAPNDAMSLGLALHELATNAAKYGALSVPNGQVSVTWSVPESDRCVIVWRECGGPPVVPPSRRGFGLELIEKIVSHELGEQIDLRFEPEGVVCTLAVPLREVREFTLRENAEF